MADALPLVGDFMSMDPVVVTPDATLDEAARLLEAYDITGLPVVDGADHPIGVISQTDLLGAPDSTGRLIRRRASALRVGEVMTSPAVTVGILESMRDAARLMLERHVHRLVAVDDTGRAIGVLSATDFVQLYAETTAPAGRRS